MRIKSNEAGFWDVFVNQGGAKLVKNGGVIFGKNEAIPLSGKWLSSISSNKTGYAIIAWRVAQTVAGYRGRVKNDDVPVTLSLDSDTADTWSGVASEAGTLHDNDLNSG
jgi:hypothetical protein